MRAKCTILTASSLTEACNVNPFADPKLQDTLIGVFQLVVPEIALLTTACITFLFGCFWNRRCLWFAVSLVGVGLAAVLSCEGIVATPPPPVIDAAPLGVAHRDPLSAHPGSVPVIPGAGPPRQRPPRRGRAGEAPPVRGPAWPRRAPCPLASR